MSSATAEVVIAGETLVLCAERAAYWPAKRTLLVADVHLGKESVFGRAGIAIPDGATGGDLARLARLVGRFAPERVVVLGDLVHAAPTAHASWPVALSAWLDRHPAVRLSVVTGNHDRPAARRTLDARIEWLGERLSLGPFALAHDPQRVAGAYALSGHVHPTLRLRTRADAVRCPVFWFTDEVGVLPSFGRFTGGYNVRPMRRDRVFVASSGVIIDVSGTGGAQGDRPWRL